MSLPPLNPDKTVAGIIVDPKTLERLVPASKRRDGTIRKEIKVRPGFTPQEDVGRFKTTRQIDQELRKGYIPGSGSGSKPKPPTTASSGNTNVGGSILGSSKSKAAIKNEKRALKRREDKAQRAWDEDSEDGDEGIREAFDLIDSKNSVRGSEEDFPVLGNISNGKKGGVEPPITKPGTGLVESNPPKVSDIHDLPIVTIGGMVVTKSEEPSWQKSKQPFNSSSTSTQKGSEIKHKPPKHPIQGNRNGPIGLANPPPIETPPPNPGGGRRTTASTVGTAGKPGGKGTSGTVEPRIRKEIKVREGGSNDISRLADRVRNLVVENQKPRVKERKSENV